MKKSLFWLCLLSLVGCLAVPEPVQFIGRAAWPDLLTKDELYNACLTALRAQNFVIDPSGTNQARNLISAERSEFILPKYDKRIRFYYGLQMTVSQAVENKVIIEVEVNFKTRETELGMWGRQVKFERSAKQNQLAQDMENLFASIEKSVGKAELLQRYSITWE